jgi:hypothetical protein
VDLIPNPVAGLLGRRAVIADAVGLDDQPERAPVEVDLEAVDPGARLGQRQAGAAGDREESPLELGVGEGERATVEGLAQVGGARSPNGIDERGTEGLRIDEVELVGFVDRAFEQVAPQARR